MSRKVLRAVLQSGHYVQRLVDSSAAALPLYSGNAGQVQCRGEEISTIRIKKV
jgi:hypothetical protein